MDRESSWPPGQGCRCGPLRLKPRWQQFGESTSQRAHVSGSRFVCRPRRLPRLARSRIAIAGGALGRIRAGLRLAACDGMHRRLAFFRADNVRPLNRRACGLRLADNLAVKVFDFARQCDAPFPAQRRPKADVPPTLSGTNWLPPRFLFPKRRKTKWRICSARLCSQPLV